jgi:hypothetical protein
LNLLKILSNLTLWSGPRLLFYNWIDELHGRLQLKLQSIMVDTCHIPLHCVKIMNFEIHFLFWKEKNIITLPKHVSCYTGRTCGLNWFERLHHVIHGPRLLFIPLWLNLTIMSSVQSQMLTCCAQIRSVFDMHQAHQIGKHQTPIKIITML